MRCLLRTVSAAAAVTVCALAGLSGTAQAESASPRSLFAPSSLVLAVGQGDEAATATIQRAVTLDCSTKPSGSHPAAAAACAELRDVDGQFAELVNTESQRACTKEWAPVVVTASGVWQGRHVSWSATFGNRCELDAKMAGGVAFRF